MKNILKYIWLFALIMLLTGLSADSFAQRRSGGSSFGGGRSSSSYSPRNYSPPRQTYQAPSSSSQMRSGGTMGSGISSGSNSSSSSSQMRSGGTMGSGVSSGSSSSSSSKMKSGGAMNSTPPPVTAPSGSSSSSRANTGARTGTDTSYRYKTYSGPKETTYNGRQVYINDNGGYSYYRGGPIIAYMPGYTPVAYTPVVGGVGFGTVLLIILGIVGIVVIIAFIANRS